MVNVRVRYVPNHADFGRFMLSPQVLGAATAAGVDIMALAEGFAPESSPSEKGSSDGTRYNEHFRVDPAVVTIDGNPRAAANVVNDATYASKVEFGIGPGWEKIESRPQGGTPGVPSRPLGRAGAAFGGYHGGPDGPARKRGKR